MSLANLLKKGSLLGRATATPATFATHTPYSGPTVATVATVAVANLQKPPANDPAPTTTLVQSLPLTDGAVIDIGTVRPAGLSPALLAASQALDAQIHAAGLLPGNDPDADCWPHSTAMNTGEIDLFTARLSRFTDKGVKQIDAESLAEKLVTRDRELDDRRLCLECTHLQGFGATSWRCGNWQRAGIAHRARDNQLPVDLVQQLQRCHGHPPTWKVL